MTLREPDAPRDGLARRSPCQRQRAAAPVGRWLPVGVLAQDADHRRLGGAQAAARPDGLITMRAVQPLLWLLIFGEVSRACAPSRPDGEPYLDFMAPGILAQSVLFLVDLLRHRRSSGSATWALSTSSWPVRRRARRWCWARRCLGGRARAAQAIIIYVLALLLGVHSTGIRWPARRGRHRDPGRGVFLHVSR